MCECGKEKIPTTRRVNYRKQTQTQTHRVHMPMGNRYLCVAKKGKEKDCNGVSVRLSNGTQFTAEEEEMEKKEPKCVA